MISTAINHLPVMKAWASCSSALSGTCTMTSARDCSHRLSTHMVRLRNLCSNKNQACLHRAINSCVFQQRINHLPVLKACASCSSALSGTCTHDKNSLTDEHLPARQVTRHCSTQYILALSSERLQHTNKHDSCVISCI